MNLIDHINRQKEWSLKTFGPGRKYLEILDHIASELFEVARAPTDVEEWIDVVILALDGAWRAGYTPEEVATALRAKQELNESRQWPDWKDHQEGKAIEHIRG